MTLPLYLLLCWAIGGVNFSLDFADGERVYTHKDCRITFRTRIRRKEEQQNKEDSDKSNVQKIPETVNRRISRNTNLLKTCFICNERTHFDENAYNNGGIGRCSETGSKDKLINAMQEKMEDVSHTFHEAACRLKILLSGNAYNDVFAVDVYYHKRCYNAFTYTYQSATTDANIKELEEQVMNNFSERFA